MTWKFICIYRRISSSPSLSSSYSLFYHFLTTNYQYSWSRSRGLTAIWIFQMSRRTV